MRLNYAAIAPEATKALAGVNAALLRAGLDTNSRPGATRMTWSSAIRTPPADAQISI
jgi:hypothetical protein